jgi:cytochrome b subunit of formate dehydrogenase
VTRVSLRSQLGFARTAAVLALLFSAAGPVHALTNQECLECHSDPGLTRTVNDSTAVSLYVGAAEFGSSVHGGFTCTDCHADIVEIPHPEKLAKVDCSTCHSDEMAQYLQSIHGRALTGGDADAPGCADCHGSHTILPASNPASSIHPQKVVGTCARCHSDLELVKKHDIAAKAPVDAYMKSVHGRALLVDGNADAPTCSTCHPAHTMLPPSDPASTINRMNIPMTCSMCHADIAEVYGQSIHGTAAASGMSDSPVCTDCHGEHDIKGPDDPQSSVFPANIAKTTCTRCHESLVLSRRYGFDANRISTFRETYHGLASKKGALNVANCASCHGIHNIFPSSDPRSTVNPANLQTTCGICHPDASRQFASIQVHPTISGEAGAPVARQPRDVARSIYVVLLLAVIGGMAAHNAVIWLYHVVEKRKRELGQARVTRFSRFEATEHLILLSSFFILVFTGFALKYADSGWVNLTERIGLSESLRGIIHRVAAVVMIAVSLTHLGFLLFTQRGRRELVAVMPTLRDVRDFVRNMAYHLHLRAERPTFAHFDYTEKAEYLALIWGTAVMVFTGFVLWFPTFFTRYLPGWVFEVSEVVHFYEAWLAFLAIIIWHFFFVIFHPESQPLNLTWMDGKTTVEHAIHRHGHLGEGVEIEYPGKDPAQKPGTGKPQPGSR